MNDFQNILNKFKEKKIIVIGDLILDKYLEGDVSRISPEAPVPIVKIEKEFYTLGGAGNVASNVASLEGNVSLFSFAGKDHNSQILRQILGSKKIKYFLDECQSTTEKTRIIGRSQQLIRFDKENNSDKLFTEQTKKIMLEQINSSDIIIISDYAKGAITKNLMQFLNQYKSKIIIDPRPKNKSLYQNAFLITPNEKESFEMSLVSDIEEAGKKLKAEFNSNILITRGENGMTLFSDDLIHLPTFPREVFDVTGAGDTVVAAMSLALASGATLQQAAIIANHAAGIAVQKRGTYSVSLDELKERILSKESKILNFEKLKRKIDDYKRNGKKIVWTNGCFDVIHSGHIHYLKESKKLGDILIVGLNSDESVKLLKGPNRPIQKDIERAEILSSIEFIDHILIFPEITVENYLNLFKPDFFVKGGDYAKNAINYQEKQIVESYNGKIVIIPKVKDISSSDIIKKIQSKNNKNTSF